MSSKIHGVEIRTKPIRDVEFVCPKCGADRVGTVVSQQRWYTIGGLPTVPLATLDEAVDCTTCRHRSSIGALDVLTAEALIRCLEAAMREAVACVVRASMSTCGVASEVLDEVFDVMLASGYEYDEKELLASLRCDDSDRLESALRPLVDEMTSYGKQGFLHRMIAIALADGPLTRVEQQALVRIGVALGMAAPHINGVLATATIQYQAVA
jgi:transcription elongation factor Elf1